jgi:cell division GTPase FtsZ
MGMLALASDSVDKDISVIRVIGVGGLGGNAVNYMIKEGLPRSLSENRHFV